MTLPANVAQYIFDVPSLGQGSAESLKVVGFDYVDSMSSLFNCEVVLATEEPAQTLKELLGKSARLIVMDPSQARYIHGEITEISQGESGNRHVLYRFRLQPKLAFLQHRSDHRIFQKKTVPDIVKKVLHGAGIASDQVTWSLNSSYSPRPYCTQYGETDLDFVQRLLAEEGLFYFFQHLPHGHRMVVSDNNTCFQPIEGESTLLFKPSTGLVADPLKKQQSVSQLQSCVKVQPSNVSLGDYNHQKSKLSLLEKAGDGDAHEHYSFYTPKFSDPAAGKAYGKARQQAFVVQQETVSGQADCPRLQIGGRFTLSEHPRKVLNQEYLLTAIQVSGTQPQALGEGATSEAAQFSVGFEAIPSSVDYRPIEIPQGPSIEGTQTAFVTGPEGEEIYTDSEARVKVQFHWDRESQGDESSSCWLRVSQALAGNKWGALVLPRVGQEVIVAFLNGDPDRPMVMGTVYNGDNKPSYPLPQGQTQTLFKSLSSPGGDGFNELKIEDAKGKEQLYLHAERDLNLRVKNQWKEFIGEQRHTTVAQNHHLQVDQDLDSQIEENSHQTVGQSLTADAGQNMELKITGSYLEQASQGIQLKAGASLVLDAAVALTLKAGSSLIKIDPSGVTVEGKMVGLNTPLGAEPIDLDTLIADSSLEGLEPEALAEKISEMEITVDPEFMELWEDPK